MTALPLIAAGLILAALLCALTREVEALWTDRPAPGEADPLAILAALSGGTGLLAAALVWGAW